MTCINVNYFPRVGGFPIGDATIWPGVSSWGDLASISNPRDGDLAPFLDTSVGAAGLALWDGSQWALFLGQFFTFGAMFAFPHPIVDAAYGIFQDRVFSWSALMTGPDSTSQPRWLPIDIYYSGATLRGYAIGDEGTEAQLLTQGVEKYENNGTFVTSFLTDAGGPYVRMDTYSSGADGGFFASGSDVEGTTNVYQRVTARTKSPASGNWNLPFFAHQQSPNGRTVRWASQNNSTLLPVSNTLSTAGSTLSLTDSGIDFDATFSIYEFIDEGQFGGCRVFIDGVFYGQINRMGGSNKSFIANGAHYGLGSYRGDADDGIGMDFKDLIMVEF